MTYVILWRCFWYKTKYKKSFLQDLSFWSVYLDFLTMISLFGLSFLLNTNPVTLQLQLSKNKTEIRHLQQIKCLNAYSTRGNYRNFRTPDGLVICRRCNHVGHFARAWKENLTSPKAPPHYQNLQSSYVSQDTLPYPQPLHIPNHNSQCAPYQTNNKRHDNMGYPYP